MRNIHDTLDPYTSARVIIAHVTDGIAMAEEANLPRQIIDVIAQHHGTTRTEVFYQKAKEHDGDNVDAELFRYPGPIPQTKEAAVVMLADATEAATRAANRAGRLNVDGSAATAVDIDAARTAAIRGIVERIVQDRLKTGQLAAAPLTLRDLDVIQRTFVTVLDGMYHPRIDYPVPAEPPPTPAEAVATGAAPVGGRHRPPRDDTRRTERLMQPADTITVVIESDAAERPGSTPPGSPICSNSPSGPRAHRRPPSHCSSPTTTGIQTLHRDYLDDDTPTDVLSFAAESDESFPIEPGYGDYLGDIAVSWDTAAMQGPEAGLLRAA